MSTRIEEITEALGEVEYWIDDADLNNAFSSDYWNDATLERHKEWWIADGDYSRCLNYIRGSGLLKEYDFASTLIRAEKRIGLRVADLGCGIGWTSALLSQEDKVSQVAAIEFSRHRLEYLFPFAIDMLRGNPNKIRRYLGSFYEVKFDPESFDIIFLAQAFHHAERPLELLLEIDRLLSPGGLVIFIGENSIGLLAQVKAIIRFFLRNREIQLNFSKLFPVDQEMGDHYYKVYDYRLLFQVLGYEDFRFVTTDRPLSVVARKGGVSVRRDIDG